MQSNPHNLTVIDGETLIDFENNKIFIGQKMLEVVRNGKTEQIVSDEMKTESSRRSFKMIPEVKEILLAHKAQQEVYRKQFRKAYSKKQLDMVCVDPLGELIKPSYVTAHFPVLLERNGLRPIRFHDLRHPYVKPKTKKYGNIFEVLGSEVAARGCYTGCSWFLCLLSRFSCSK